MAEAQKLYQQSVALLYNLAADIAEMYKAKVTADYGEWFGFETVMYKRKNRYVFRFSKQADGCMLTIAADGGDEQAAQRVSFMFAIVDGMISTLNVTESTQKHSLLVHS